MRYILKKALVMLLTLLIISVLAFAAFEYVILAWQLAFLEGEAAGQALEFLKEYRWILRYGRTARTRLTGVVSGLIGLRGTAKLLDFYMKNR